MTMTATKPQATHSKLDTLRAMLAGLALLDVTFTGGPRKGERVCSLVEPATGRSTETVAADLCDELVNHGLVVAFDEDDAGNTAYTLSGRGAREAFMSFGHADIFGCVRSAMRAEMQCARVETPTTKTTATAATTQYTLSNGRAASHYQAAILNWVEGESGDAIVGAVAGSGKTSLLVTAARHIKGEGVFLAFNKAIAEELGRQLSGTMMSAKTIHAIGYAALKQGMPKAGKPEESKYKKLCDEYVLRYRKEFGEDIAQAQRRLRKLCDFSRFTLAAREGADAIERMAARYSLDCEEKDGERVRSLISLGDSLAERDGVIDFTDMIWLTVTKNLTVPRLPFVLVDECQDLSAMQLALVRMLRAEGGRMLFVGDERQAIMSFAGADSRSYHTIRDTLGAREFPLSICYRCPASHVQLAKALVPQIEARENAPQGTVEYIASDKLVALARKDDMIISRRNAPLIKYCLKLINAGKAARIKGRDIGKELAELVRVVDKVSGYIYSKFPEAVSEWETKQRANLDAKNAPEPAYEILSDKVETLRELYAGNPHCKTGAELADSIAALFADESKNAVWLSSVHRAKGLEADRVFVVEHERLGQRHPKASDDEYQQERNLFYVALTRAKSALYFC
jgi:superfamily I DNA/RNA helicase